MAIARVNGISLYYEVHGEGEPLLWIGGLGANVREIPHLIDVYPQRSRFIVYEGRGCGRSDKPAEDYTIPGLADDAAALLDAIGVESAFVYGSSMGGMVAQELALNHPQRVRALVLGCTTAGPIRGVRPSDETVKKIVRNQALTGDEGIEAGWELGYSARFIAANRAEMLERSRHAAELAAPREAYMRQVIAAARHDAYDRLQYIRCPVLILHGSDDVMMPLENAWLLKRAIPHAEVTILQGAGHGYNLEFQAEADVAVFDFIERAGSIVEGAGHAAG